MVRMIGRHVHQGDHRLDMRNGVMAVPMNAHAIMTALWQPMMISVRLAIAANNQGHRRRLFGIQFARNSIHRADQHYAE